MSVRAATWAGGAARPLVRLRAALSARMAAFARLYADAWEEERAWRRPILWAPVACGVGVVLSLAAEREPALWFVAPAFALAAGLAYAARGRALAFGAAMALACILFGYLAMGLRTARVAAPIIARPMIASLTGYVEQIDHRAQGARLVLRVVSMERMAAAETPHRVRVTVRRGLDLPTGALVGLKARLLPPAQAALPGGYDFARDAYFAGIGGVGNVLGRIEMRQGVNAPPFAVRFRARVDDIRNALVKRVVEKLPGDTGAIAAAMVAGKRDFLTPSARELIREAGIFHIITISGVQMTLVAGIFFVGFRRLLALSPHLALNYPIKKWAAALAICGALTYDILTGSRVGAERALVMTAIFLAATLADRPSISMRNLAMAVVFVILVEPEAILGASFQLSFAAVAALIAVWEARLAAQNRLYEAPARLNAPRWRRALAQAGQWRWHGIGGMLFATLCATSATASFMAANFHELSPYVMIGNPLTLAMIEFFAIPAALLGTLLCPLGLDGPVWIYLGLGVDLVLAIARYIAAAPAATVHLREFAPWALPFLAMGVLSATLWRTNAMRMTALPFIAIGLVGAFHGPHWDAAILPTGETMALREGDGKLTILGKRADFAAEQWLRADADGRPPSAATAKTCDRNGCVGALRDGRMVALVSNAESLAEDCARADVIVTPHFAPDSCGAALVIDKRMLMKNGATTLTIAGDALVVQADRALGQNRPWSRAPKIRQERPDLIRPFDRDADDAQLGQGVWESLD